MLGELLLLHFNGAQQGVIGYRNEADFQFALGRSWNVAEDFEQGPIRDASGVPEYVKLLRRVVPLQ